ncbi:MAG: DUF4105 domain-containing protein [Spirochaetaceae bacterium]|nr:DUF4105 domain-containing protein [Spirochaetaceae bacterium]
MKTYKHYFLIFALLTFFIFPIYSFDLINHNLIDPFESGVELNKFHKISDSEIISQKFYDDCTISLLTKSAGDAIYSWFGHSEILIETPTDSIIYDYGVFSFNSEKFYSNFAQGKMDYVLYTSYYKSSLYYSEKENRTVKKLKLNLSNAQKASIISFLNYNSKIENRTYLYDFYKDNCATRIRDILSWTSDNDFKKWAQSQPSNGSFRKLSNRSISRNLPIFFALNLIQGHNADTPTTLWDDMYLPSHLEAAVKQYNKIGSSEKILFTEDGSRFNISEKNNNHTIFFSIMALILGIIALTFKRVKVIRNSRIFGIFNIIILLLLTIFSFVMLYLTFFSGIYAGWRNENLIFLNPLTAMIALTLAIRMLNKKKQPIKRVSQFERICRWIADIIFVLFILKLIFPTQLYQNNLNIISPFFIFFALQGFLFRSEKY